MADTEVLFTAEEVAERLRVAPQTVHQWRRDGRIPAIEITPRTFRFSYGQILAVLRGQSRRAEGAAGDREGQP
ncbi:MAG: helix-turn-helix domain-containing protein [Planctomycetes bacterium]|nr:helix-turn-helix domain-containing protein [Planctomycetota bacterium]